MQGGRQSPTGVSGLALSDNVGQMGPASTKATDVHCAQAAMGQGHPSLQNASAAARGRTISASAQRASSTRREVFLGRPRTGPAPTKVLFSSNHPHGNPRRHSEKPGSPAVPREEAWGSPRQCAHNYTAWGILGQQPAHSGAGGHRTAATSNPRVGKRVAAQGLPLPNHTSTKRTGVGGARGAPVPGGL